MGRKKLNVVQLVALMVKRRARRDVDSTCRQMQRLPYDCCKRSVHCDLIRTLTYEKFDRKARPKGARKHQPTAKSHAKPQSRKGD
jgi:hypothetical protein